MADFSVNPVAQNLKPPTPMSLGEMVNLARSAQEYQQAQQLNPLAVQRSAAELSRLQQLMPEEYRRAQAEADRAATEATVSEKTSKPRIEQAGSSASSAASTAEQDRLKLFKQKQKLIQDSQVSLINDELVIAAEKNPTEESKTQLVNLFRKRGLQLAKDLDIKLDEAEKLLQPYLEIAATNPGAARAFLKQRHIQGLDDAARSGILQPSGVGVTSGIESKVISTNEFGATPVGTAIPGTTVQQLLMPNEQLVQDNTGNQFIATKDNQGRITIRPVTAAPNTAPAVVPPAVAPAATPAVSSGNAAVIAPKPSPMSQNAAQVQPTANLPDFSQPVPPRFPLRVPGQPVFNLQQGEKEAQDAGGKYLRNVVANRNTVNPIRGNIEKIVATTDQLLAKQGFQAGKGLQIEQYFTKLIDDSDYKQLSKQIANLQIALIGNNPQALSTDAGKQMSAAALGNEVYPPQVLQKIAVQTYGEMEARDKLGQAADKYGRRFGETNMASFGQMWDNNSDSKVFELMALPKLIKDKKLRTKMANEIIGYPIGSEERTIIENKYMNIQKLIKDGTL
jgi:hypothetical protein